MSGSPEWLVNHANDLQEVVSKLQDERAEIDRWTVQIAMTLGVSCDGEGDNVREQYRELRKRILAATEKLR